MSGRSYAGDGVRFHFSCMKPRMSGFRIEGQNHPKMSKPNNIVAVRTLVMAAVLVMGLVATMFAKGLISTAVLAS